MTVHFLTSPNTWFEKHVENLRRFCETRGWDCGVLHDHSVLAKGDLLFILSYYRIVPSDALALHTNNIVIHASDLPRGRGFSPLAWQILEGSNEIVFSLFEAAPQMDAGPVYAKESLHLNGTELYAEWRDLSGELIERMAREFLAAYPTVKAEPQTGEPTSYRRRTREDDRISVDAPIAHVFDHLRICDPDEYPAWFEFRNRKYKIRIEPFQ